jgi:hypothetical protein
MPHASAGVVAVPARGTAALPRVYAFCKGILNTAAGNRDWDDRAERWVGIRGLGATVKFETPRRWAISARWFVKRDADELVETTRDFAGNHRIIWVCHSNACRIACRAMQMADYPVDELHLISAACDWDLEYTGLAEAMRNGRLGRLEIYCAGQDAALGLYAESWVGRWLSGFCRRKTLGLHGPKPASTRQLLINITIEPNYGHSEWFDGPDGLGSEPSKFDRTMRRVTRAAL